MPIEGLTGKHRLPRLGKIHLGIKDTKMVKGQPVEYPRAVDYFVCPDPVKAVFGEEPKELRILIPVEDPDRWASQYYRCYTRTRGLVCKGDGVNAMRMVDQETGTLADPGAKKVIMKDIPCQGRECPEYGKQCHEVMCLQFLLPEVAGLGIWQIDTGSINSIRNINSASELIRSIYGRISMIPLILALEPLTIQDPESGKKRDVHVLNLRTNQTMLELLEASRSKEIAIRGEGEPELPIADDEVPDRIIPQAQKNVVTAEAEAKGEIAEEELKPEPQPQKLGLIDKQWFAETLSFIQGHKKEAWSNDKLLRYLTISYRVKGDTVEEAVANLGKDAADHFVKKMKEAMASIKETPK